MGYTKNPYTPPTKKDNTEITLKEMQKEIEETTTGIKAPEMLIRNYLIVLNNRVFDLLICSRNRDFNNCKTEEIESIVEKLKLCNDYIEDITNILYSKDKS